jgi:hypothetical protein
MAASTVESPAFAAAVKRAADKKEYRMMVFNWESSETMKGPVSIGQPQAPI